MERAVLHDRAGANFGQRPFRMAAADGALVKRALAAAARQFDAADHFARLQRIVGGAVGAVAQQVADRQPVL